MTEVLSKYLPEHAVLYCFELIKSNNVHLKIVNERQTRHGDYRKGLSGKHEIDRKSTRLNSSHVLRSRMPSSA